MWLLSQQKQLLLLAKESFSEFYRFTKEKIKIKKRRCSNVRKEFVVHTKLLNFCTCLQFGRGQFVFFSASKTEKN